MKDTFLAKEVSRLIKEKRSTNVETQSVIITDVEYDEAHSNK
jgi:hypothetical protein